MDVSEINYETIPQTGVIIVLTIRSKYLCSCVIYIPNATYEYWACTKFAGLHAWATKT